MRRACRNAEAEARAGVRKRSARDDEKQHRHVSKENMSNNVHAQPDASFLVFFAFFASDPGDRSRL